ncbi:MAG: VPS10 domain-containing protein [Flavobacteriales bacterium]
MRSLFFTLLCGFALHTSAQTHLQPIHTNETLPPWAEMMYSASPDVHAVRAAYDMWFTSHPFEKTVHTQYYKRWLSAILGDVTAEGAIAPLTADERRALEDHRRAAQAMRGNEIWSYAGPEIHRDSDGSLTPISDHSNVYTFDRTVTNPQLMFCGTESGGLYKTTDGGENWTFVTKELLVGAVSAVRIHPANADIAIFSGANDLYRTTDGGNSWQVIGQPSFVSQNISAWEILFHPTTPEIIFAATNLGLYRSADGGDNWTEILTNETMTVVFKPNDPSVVFAIQYETTLGYSRFYKSTDTGLTFSLRDTGWFTEQPGFTSVNNEGGRLAVTEADPNRIYAMLLGYGTYSADVETNGWIGIWVSNDAGETWMFPHGQIGTPYSEDHPNLMNFSADDGTYTQIFYNSTIAASQLDADKVLIGGLNLWISNDACATYEGVAGYIGGLPRFHVDQQEIRIFKTSETTEEVWISNDGGINFSNDFMESFESRCKGIMAVNLWGYDQGWSEDIMVGGRYHNGNMAYHELYPAGEFLSLGGGEAPTGYVNYSNERKTYFSDLGGRVLPPDMDGQVTGFGVNTWPNESYWFNESSRILFDRHYYNVAWLGRDHQLFKSQDGGNSFSLVYSFGTNPDKKVLWFEQCYSNPNVMYVHQRTNSNPGSIMWRTADGGLTWQEVPLPLVWENLVFDIGSTNENEIWIGYPYAGYGKIWHTVDAGANWTNLSTPTLSFEEIWSVAHQYGTNGGVYLALKNGRVLYRNNAMSDWEEYSTGLPAGTEPLRIVPFYKGEKIRLATWNLGVWEAPFFESSTIMADFQAGDSTFYCAGDAVAFADHSVVPAGATYEWEFPGGTPSFSNDQHPVVVYDSEGTFDVTLTVTFGNQSASSTKQAYIGSQDVVPADGWSEPFESGGIRGTWREYHPTGGTHNWTVSSEASAFGEGNYSMVFDNYWIDVQGHRDEIWTEQCYFWSGKVAWGLFFDVAYAEYGYPYSDTLAVYYSPDCGVSWELIYLKGGDDLETAENTTEPFIPTAGQWRSEIVSLDSFDEEATLTFAFQNRGHWGNRIYVDDIYLAYSGNTADISFKSLSILPNPADNQLTIRSPQQRGMMEVFDATGRLVESVLIREETTILDVSDWSPGVYLFRLGPLKHRVLVR